MSVATMAMAIAILGTLGTMATNHHGFGHNTFFHYVPSAQTPVFAVCVSFLYFWDRQVAT